MHRGVWWATVHGIAKMSDTTQRLKSNKAKVLGAWYQHQEKLPSAVMGNASSQGFLLFACFPAQHSPTVLPPGGISSRRQILLPPEAAQMLWAFPHCPRSPPPPTSCVRCLFFTDSLFGWNPLGSIPSKSVREVICLIFQLLFSLIIDWWFDWSWNSNVEIIFPWNLESTPSLLFSSLCCCLEVWGYPCIQSFAMTHFSPPSLEMFTSFHL